MAIALESYDGDCRSTAGSDTTVTFDGSAMSVSVGDVLIVFIGSNNSTPTPPYGWTEEGKITSSNYDLWCYSKVATTDEQSSFTFNLDGGYGYWHGLCVRLSGADQATTDIAFATGVSSARDYPGLTVSANGSLVLWACVASIQEALPEPTGTTEFYDVGEVSNYAYRLGCAYSSADAGALSGKSTSTSYGGWACCTIAVGPAGAPPAAAKPALWMGVCV